MSSILINLYTDLTGARPATVTQLAGAGSNRRYYRLEGDRTLIGVVGESAEENDSFIYLSGHLAAAGVRVPKVVAVSHDRMAYLQEDLGDMSLFDFMAEGRMTDMFSTAETDLLKRSLAELAKAQYIGAKGLDFSKCYPVAEFDKRTVDWDLNYFKYCFLKVAGVGFNESRLEDDFDTLRAVLLDGAPFNTFMYRDFQSRNVMILDGQAWLIDFQGGRRGPAEYDVASFLWQAKANIPQSLRDTLIDHYIATVKSLGFDIDAPQFRKSLRYFVLFRLLQVLGAYGYRGLIEKKAHFLESIPKAVSNLRDLMADGGFDDLPTISAIIDILSHRYLDNAPATDGLIVTVTSFSFKKGIPDDKTGNGGGFVFDCRGMHNPGRYEEYKRLTGLDEPVIRFLEERGEIQPYLEACYYLVDKSVETYLRRGFTSLMVSFGCTGGRHRSVYCAEAMGRYLASKYPAAHILIHHREQSLTTHLNSINKTEL